MNLPSFEPCTIWITGITASGKTTLGKSLFEFLIEKGVNPLEFLDGDEIRESLNKNYGYSLKDRQKIVKNIVEIVKNKNKKGITTIVSTVSHKKAMRDYARSQIPKFIEVYLECPNEVCADRDYKGLYEKAKAGEYQTFPGVTEPYEPSENPELILNTSQMSIDECSATLFKSILPLLGNT